MATMKGLAVIFLLMQVGIKAEEAFFTTSSSLEYQENDGTISLHFTLPVSNISGSSYTADITIFHISTDDGDVTFTSVTNKASSGDTVSVDITLVDDSIFEGPENFILEVTAGFDTTIQGGKINFTFTIIDDELMPVSLTVPELSSPFPEHRGVLHFVVLFEDETPRSIDYPFYVTFSGSPASGADSATSGDDFTPVIEDEQLVIPAGYTWTWVPFNITDDDVVENTEHVEVTVYGANLNQNYTSSIYIKDNDEIRYFDCSRFGQDCGVNGTCNQFTCDCDCDTGFQGFDCNIESSSVVSSCDVACVNGACVNNGTARTCVCDEGYTGADCSQTPYQVKCDDEFMYVCLEIAADFQGHVFLDGRPDCMLNETGPDCNGLYGKFPLTGEDNCKATFNNKTDPQQSELTIFIQFNPYVNTGDNQVVLMRCHHQGAGNYTIGEVDPVAIIQQPSGHEPVGQKPPLFATCYPPYSIDAGTSTLRDQLLLTITPTTEVTPGTVLEYCFSAKVTTGGFRFEGIGLHNGISKGSVLYAFITLFDQYGCRLNPEDGIVLEDINGNKYKKCFKFSAIKLAHTSINQIQAEVHIFELGVAFNDNICSGAAGTSIASFDATTNMTVTINGDELMPVNLTVPEITSTIPEHQGPLEFAVFFEDETPRSVDYPFYVTFAGSVDHPFSLTFLNGVDAATSGVDFTPVIEDVLLIIPAGQICTSISFNITDDEEVENIEHIEVTVYGVNLNQNYTSSIYIKDNDVMPVNLTVPDIDINFPIPEDSGTHLYNVLFEDETPRPVDYSFYVTFAGSAVNGADAATSGDDFTPVIEDEQLVIRAGQISASISFNITDDHEVENTEHIEVTVYGANLNQNYTGSIYIKDNDVMPVNLTVPDIDINFPIPEDSGTLSYNVLFEDETPRPVDYSFYITFAGSTVNGADAATSGDDFTPVIEDEQLVIRAGQISASISFNITDDHEVENTEHIEVTVYGANLNQNYTGSIYIKDNDDKTGGFTFHGIILNNGLVKGNALYDARILFNSDG